MRIDTLKLKNFRCYERLEIDFDHKLTMLVGENGRGKTAIFDAIAIALAPYLRAFAVEGKQIQSTDVRCVPVYAEGSRHIVSMQNKFPLEIELVGSVDNELITSKFIYFADGRMKNEVHSLEGVACRIARDATIEGYINLPVLAYYGTSRIWVDSSLMKETISGLVDKNLGYKECLEPSSSYNTFGKWLANVTENLAKSDVDDAYLLQVSDMKDAILQAIDACLFSTGLHDLHYSLNLKTFVVSHAEWGELLVENLSDGFRSVLSMVADLAYRMVCLNPHLGARAVLDTPGVVLIDEIDMHLHPIWQQTVLLDLERVFPKVQFIVTTHSPQVLSTVPAECIRVLEWEKQVIGVRHVDFAMGAASDQLLQDIQNVQPRTERLPIVKDLNRYLELVGEDKWDSEEAKTLRERLDAWSHGNEPALLRADMDIRLRQMRRKRS